VSGMWRLAVPGVRAHRAGMAGTALTLAAAGAVLATVGVLLESGLRGGSAGTALLAAASSYGGTTLIVVLLVVAATVTLALRARRRELALLRTVGATRHQVRGLVALEVLLVAGVAVPLGAVPGVLLAARLTPLLRHADVLGVHAHLSLSPLPVLGAVAVLVPSAVLAGGLGARESVRVPAVDALRGSDVEHAGIGPVRRVLALLAALAGLSAALSPAVVPGTVGAASAALSAFLLVGAVALAGPLLVARAFGRAARRERARTEPSTWLALQNVRGFSRRLTTVIVPFALALAIGTVQSSADAAVTEAGRQQLRAAVGADLVVTGASADRAAELADAPGVAQAAPLWDVPVEVRTDDGDSSALAWDAAALRVVPPDTPATVLDPAVTRGSLGALRAPGTVAVSADAAFDLGRGLGAHVTVRTDGAEHRLRVVAVYDRGLGLGDYLTGPSTARALGARPGGVTALVATSGPATATAAELRSRGLQVSTAATYVAAAVGATAASQHLSTVLLLVLLVFIGIGAADALVMTTAGRRGELTLLHRTGTTRRQLVRMAVVESLLTGGLAWAVGTAAVVPAVLGMSVGLLGVQVPVADAATYLVLSVAVLVTATGATVLTAAWVARRSGPALPSHGRAGGRSSLGR